MDLAIKGDFAKKLFVLCKKDKALARSLAKQWVERIEPNVLFPYLLDQETTLYLLTRMLKKDPRKTVDELQSLAEGNASKAIKKGTRRKKATPRKKAVRPGRQKKGPSKGMPRAKAKATPAAKMRRRLTADEVMVAKDKVKSYLRTHTWATRNELIEAANLTTPSIYRRIINELKDSGDIISKGEKSKTVYGLNVKGKKGR